MVNPVLKVYSLSSQGEAALVSVRGAFVAFLNVTQVLVVARSFHIHVEQQTGWLKKKNLIEMVGGFTQTYTA